MGAGRPCSWVPLGCRPAAPSARAPRHRLTPSDPPAHLPPPQTGGSRGRALHTRTHLHICTPPHSRTHVHTPGPSGRPSLNERAVTLLSDAQTGVTGSRQQNVCPGTPGPVRLGAPGGSGRTWAAAAPRRGDGPAASSRPAPCPLTGCRHLGSGGLPTRPGLLERLARLARCPVGLAQSCPVWGRAHGHSGSPLPPTPLPGQGHHTKPGGGTGRPDCLAGKAGPGQFVDGAGARGQQTWAHPWPWKAVWCWQQSVDTGAPWGLRATLPTLSSSGTSQRELPPAAKRRGPAEQPNEGAKGGPGRGRWVPGNPRSWLRNTFFLGFHRPSLGLSRRGSASPLPSHADHTLPVSQSLSPGDTWPCLEALLAVVAGQVEAPSTAQESP